MSKKKNILKGYSKESVAYRDSIMEEYNWCCAVCGTADRDNLNIDHVIPESTGGSNELDNLQVLCTPCNCQIKGNVPTERLSPKKPNRDSLKAYKAISKKRMAFRCQINGARKDLNERGFYQKNGTWYNSNT